MKELRYGKNIAMGRKGMLDTYQKVLCAAKCKRVETVKTLMILGLIAALFDKVRSVHWKQTKANRQIKDRKKPESRLLPDKHADVWMGQELKPGMIGHIQGKVTCADTLDKSECWRE